MKAVEELDVKRLLELVKAVDELSYEYIRIALDLALTKNNAAIIKIMRKIKEKKVRNCKYIFVI